MPTYDYKCTRRGHRKDFYLVLQVSREATSEEIRSAYRRRAHELHPDKTGRSSEPFLELQEAYAVLSDPARRAAYDRAGSVRGRRAEKTRSWRRHAEPFREPEPADNVDESSPWDFFGPFEPPFDDLFERFWSNFEQAPRSKARRSKGVTLEVPLSREEAAAGGKVRLSLPVRVACPTCLGDGAIGLYECWQCDGQGILEVEYPLEVPYPRGLRREHVACVPLDELGMPNLSLKVIFCPQP